MGRAAMSRRRGSGLAMKPGGPASSEAAGHPLGIDRAQDHEGKLGKEIAMLLGHEIAENRPADPVHLLLAETHAGLEGALARMPRGRGHVLVGETVHFRPRISPRPEYR